MKEKSIRNNNITNNKVYDQYFAPLRWINGDVSEMLNLWLKVDLQGDLKRSRRILGSNGWLHWIQEIKIYRNGGINNFSRIFFCFGKLAKHIFLFIFIGRKANFVPFYLLLSFFFIYGTS